MYDCAFALVKNNFNRSVFPGNDRESATKEKITERYRMLMKINHPDRGGSPFVSAKVNEAKELLMTRARAENES